MQYSLLGRGLRHALKRPASERATRGGQGDLFDGMALFKIEQLKRGVVLGIRRGSRHPSKPTATRRKTAPGGNDAFLVGKRHHGAPLKGCKRRCKAGGAHDRTHDHVGGTTGRLQNRLAAPARTSTPVRARLLFTSFEERRVADHHRLGLELERIADQPRQRSGARLSPRAERHPRHNAIVRSARHRAWPRRPSPCRQGLSAAAPAPERGSHWTACPYTCSRRAAVPRVEAEPNRSSPCRRVPQTIKNSTRPACRHDRESGSRCSWHGIGV